MRAFLGFPTPPETVEYVGRVRRFLEHHGVAGKWVRPDNLHLTVLFLGDQAPDTLDRLTCGLRNVAPDLVPVSLGYGGVGSFGAAPRLLFLGWHETPSGAFARITEQAQLCAIAAGIQFTPEDLVRDAVPHLTFVRFRSRRDTLPLTRIAAYAAGTWNWSVPAPDPLPDSYHILLEALTLYQSVLKPEGPEYSVLARIPLGRPAATAPSSAAP